MIESPRRIQRLRTKGWRMPVNTVYVGRPSKWGNPFTVENWMDVSGSNDRAVASTYCTSAYKQWVIDGDKSPFWFHGGAEQHAWIREHIGELRGVNLACWCRSEHSCHADVLLHLASVKMDGNN